MRPWKNFFILLHGLAPWLLVDTGPVRIKTRKQRSAGGSADGALTMGIGKEHAPLGQPVDVWRESLRMTIHATHPVIKIVDGDQKGIRLGPSGPRSKGQEKQGIRERSLHGAGIGQASLRSYRSTLIFLPLLPDLTPLKVLRFDPSPTFTV